MYLHSKPCPRCKTNKPLFDFYENLSACKLCHRAYIKTHTSKNKEQKKVRDSQSRRKRKFGIAESDYQDMIAKQNNLCAICNNSEKEGKSLCIDHCHTTGKIRGLLCYKCNLGIGHFVDDLDRLQSAIDYLKKFK